jgi:hypothetical protein
MQVLDVLRCCEVNLVVNRGNYVSFLLGKEQLKKAIAALEKHPDASLDIDNSDCAGTTPPPEIHV